MIQPFRRTPKRSIARLYGAIVARARDARFYGPYRVPDTVEGRFDMILLHTALLLRQLRKGDAAALAQGVFDAFCRDIDHNLREMGISDQGVPREMRRVGEAFYGRAQAYDAALDAGGEGALAQALSRNVYAGLTEPAAAAGLAAYVRLAADTLNEQASTDLMRGEVRFPEPVLDLAIAERV